MPALKGRAWDQGTLVKVLSYTIRVETEAASALLGRQTSGARYRRDGTRSLLEDRHDPTENGNVGALRRDLA